MMRGVLVHDIDEFVADYTTFTPERVTVGLGGVDGWWFVPHVHENPLDSYLYFHTPVIAPNYDYGKTVSLTRKIVFMPLINGNAGGLGKSGYLRIYVNIANNLRVFFDMNSTEGWLTTANNPWVCYKKSASGNSTLYGSGNLPAVVAFHTLTVKFTISKVDVDTYYGRVDVNFNGVALSTETAFEPMGPDFDPFSNVPMYLYIFHYEPFEAIRDKICIVVGAVL